MNWSQTLARHGLNIFAAARVHRLPLEILGDIPNHPDQTLCLVGNGGRALWEKLPRPVRAEDHPIDRYTLHHLAELGDSTMQIIYPDSKWLIPLQKLGRILNVARPSLLGLDINETFGPWFAYRAVFLTSQRIPETAHAEFTSPCESCADKPCLSACPSGAVGQPFDVKKCGDFRFSRNSPCADRCLARMRCPAEAEHRYSLEQIQYHMLRPAHLAKFREVLGKR
jgi:hypothetical protein